MFRSKVGNENTLVCYGNKPYLYTGIPNQAQTFFFLRCLGLKATGPSGHHSHHCQGGFCHEAK